MLSGVPDGPLQVIYRCWEGSDGAQQGLFCTVGSFQRNFGFNQMVQMRLEFWKYFKAIKTLLHLDNFLYICI